MNDSDIYINIPGTKAKVGDIRPQLPNALVFSRYQCINNNNHETLGPNGSLRRSDT